MLCVQMHANSENPQDCFHLAELWKANEQITIMLIKLERVHHFLVPVSQILRFHVFLCSIPLSYMWTVGHTKSAIFRCHFGMWELVMRKS